MQTNLKQQRRCRRDTGCINKEKFHQMLSNAQKYSIGKLKIFGYELLFVRAKEMNAYLKHSENYVKVFPNGKIDYSPDMELRT